MDMIDEFKDEEIEFEDQKRNIIILRDWQRRAKNFFYENNNNTIFEVATGSGKTLVAIEILKELIKKHNIRVLIIVPKNIIMESTWYKELVDLGTPIQDIGVFYGNIKEFSKITLTNIQSVKKIPLEIFDFLIADEIHNMGTKNLLKVLQHPFKHRLGLTATLKRMDNKHFDIMKIFDYNIFKYEPKQALNEGILNPFDFLNIGVKLDNKNWEEYEYLSQQLNTIFQRGGSYNKLMKETSPLKFKMLGLMNKRKELVSNYHEKFNIARQIILKHRNDKIIVFNQFNSQTSKMYWILLDDYIKCRVIHSGISNDLRERYLTEFKYNKINVLLTSKVLDEGFNIPKLDVAIIMAGDSSDKQTIQRMGRVLRKKDNKNSVLYQIYCMNTIEEDNANHRSIIFKTLSSRYKEQEYFGDDNLELDF